MKEIIVNHNDSGNRLDKFMTKTFPNIPQSLIYKYIRKKRIKINNKKADVSQKIQANDSLQLYLNDDLLIQSPTKNDFKNAPIQLDIIYEDENIILVNKKPGLLVHPDANCYTDCLINRIKNYLFKKNEYDPKNENSFSPALVNRIDRNTSGIVITAKNAQTLRILNQKMKLREIDKQYICIVCGKLHNQSDTLKGYLNKNLEKNKVYIHDKRNNNAKSIITKYTVIDSNECFSLLNISLLTGRTHQIRAHMASIGHPILGDGKYGTNSINQTFKYKYQALCSKSLKFNFKSDADILNYLNHKEFQIPDNKIWFVNDFYDNLK